MPPPQQQQYPADPQAAALAALAPLGVDAATAAAVLQQLPGVSPDLLAQAVQAAGNLSRAGGGGALPGLGLAPAPPLDAAPLAPPLPPPPPSAGSFGSPPSAGTATPAASSASVSQRVCAGPLTLLKTTPARRSAGSKPW